MIDVPVEKCPFCESRDTHCIGHPRHGRKYCLGCKAQKDKGEWHTHRQWDLMTNCGCCRLRDTEECAGCKDFDKWKDDNMEREPLPEGWLPPFLKEKKDE